MRRDETESENGDRENMAQHERKRLVKKSRNERMERQKKRAMT
jgi:hypothetical protein